MSAQLTAARDAARAAWVAAGRPKSGPLFEAGMAAAQALAAATKPAAISAAEQARLLAAHEERQRQAAQQRAEQARVAAAYRRYEAAMEWPRCGQGWPATEQERQDATIVSTYQ